MTREPPEGYHAAGRTIVGIVDEVHHDMSDGSHILRADAGSAATDVFVKDDSDNPGQSSFDVPAVWFSPAVANKPASIAD